MSHTFQQIIRNMRYTLTIILLLLLSDVSFGQKFLQLERVHSPKTKKYFPGDEITFQMVNGQWYTRVIDDISYEQKLVLFAQGAVHVDSIMALRSFKRKRVSKSLGNQLYNFAVAWTVFSLVASAVDDEDTYSRGDVAVAATSIGTGFLLQKLFRQRTFRMEKNSRGEAKKWRLRVLDLEVVPSESG